MLSSSTEESASSLFLRVAVPLLDSHLTSAVSFLWRLGRRIISERSYSSDYEILSYKAHLELLDPHGHEALFTKQERVRFLQNNILAYQDMAWGVGDIFADYRCSPGVPVDTYREGHRYHILISLRETKNRGDVSEFHINRRIIDGFTASVEDFQHEIIHVMQFASFSIIFPASRLPKSVNLVEQNTTRVLPLGDAYQNHFPDGRLQVTWETTHPRLFEAYILRWTW